MKFAVFMRDLADNSLLVEFTPGGSYTKFKRPMIVDEGILLYKMAFKRLRNGTIISHPAALGCKEIDGVFICWLTPKGFEQ